LEKLFLERKQKKEEGEELGQVIGKLSLQGKGTKQKNHLFYSTL
jgi:hypothetical protein